MSARSSSPGVFDPAKLEWLNGEHLRRLSPQTFADDLLEYLQRVGSPLADQPQRVAEVAPIVQEKLRELSQFEGFAGFLFWIPTLLIGTRIIEFRTMLLIGLTLALPFVAVGMENYRDYTRVRYVAA